MPLMDFLADVDADSSYFNTACLSKVKQSHNFRLSMPFRRHVRMEVTNPSSVDLFGYSEVQWEQVGSIPPQCGTLRVDYRTGVMRMPQEPVTLWDIHQGGNVVAHWLQLESGDARCARGDLLCEGNQEIYLDGDVNPALEHLGTEDFYGFSWGFQDVQSDGVVAILKRQELAGGGARIALLRTRTTDRLRFEHACRLVLNYQYDARNEATMLWKMQQEGGIPVPYRSCVYYYANEP
jgi:hypothetical protein